VTLVDLLMVQVSSTLATLHVFGHTLTVVLHQTPQNVVCKYDGLLCDLYVHNCRLNTMRDVLFIKKNYSCELGVYILIYC
jgi:hypothetical protein